jgi:hypothetical protein
MAKPSFGIPKVKTKNLIILPLPSTTGALPTKTSTSTSNSSPIPKTNFGVPSATPGTAASGFSTTGGGGVTTTLGGGTSSGASSTPGTSGGSGGFIPPSGPAGPTRADPLTSGGGGSGSSGGSRSGGSGVADGTVQLDRSTATNRNIINRGLASIKPSPAVAQAQKTIQSKTNIGIDVLVSSEAYKNNNGLSTIRPEFVCLSKFLQTTNIDGITPVSQLMNLQYNLCQLRQENLFRIISSISKDSNSNSLLNDLRTAFNSELQSLTNQVNALKKINSDLNQLRNSLELKNISNLNFNTQLFLTLKDFYISKMSYTENQFNSFSDTKIYLQLLSDLKNILPNFSVLYNEENDRRLDNNPIKIETLNTSEITFSINNISSAEILKYSTNKTNYDSFITRLSAFGTNDTKKISILATTLSKILLLSKNFSPAIQNKLRINSDIELNSTKTNFGELVTGEIPINFFSNPVDIQGISKKISDFACLNSLPEINDGTILLPFENQYIDDIENTKSFIPGSMYFVDSIVKPINELPLAPGFTQTITSFKTQSYKKFANDFIAQNDETREIVSSLFDQFSNKTSVDINNKILNSITKTLNFLNSNTITDTNSDEDKTNLFWANVFKKASKDKRLRFRLFQLLIMDLSNSATNIGSAIKKEFRTISSNYNTHFTNITGDSITRLGLESFLGTDIAVSDRDYNKLRDFIINGFFYDGSQLNSTEEGNLWNNISRIPEATFAPSNSRIKSIISAQNQIQNNLYIDSSNSPYGNLLLVTQEIIENYISSNIEQFFQTSSGASVTKYGKVLPSTLILLIHEIYCSYFNLLVDVDCNIENDAISDPLSSRNIQFLINIGTNTENGLFLKSILTRTVSQGIGIANITSVGSQTTEVVTTTDTVFNTASGEDGIATNIQNPVLTTVKTINGNLLQEENVIPNILHILWVISQQFKNGITNVDTNFSPQKYSEYSILFRNFNLDFSDLINPTQIRLNSYLLDTLKEKTPSRVSTTATPDISNMLISDMITKEELSMLYSYLQQEKFTSDISNNRIKIISAGVPDGFSQKIKERIILNTSNTNVDRNAFRNTEIDILTINIHKRSHLLDDLVFKPQKFLFDLSLFQKEKGIIDINPIAGERYSNLISRNILTDYNDPDKLKEVTSNTIITDPKYVDRLTQIEIRQLFENMNSSYLLGLYINLLTGMNIVEEELLTRKLIPLGTLLPQNFINALNSYVNRNLNYPGTLPLDSDSQTRALLDPYLPLNIKDIISLISNGSVVLSIQSISERIRSAKAFERIFNIAFDDQDFTIDVEKMSSTSSGRDFLRSYEYSRIINPLTNKLNDDYYRNNAFKIDSYHIQLEAQFIRL